MKKSLVKYTYLSILTSLIVISLKIIAYLLTKSIGFLSDAIESLVNLLSAFFAYLMLKLAEKPEDENHPYGHSKAEYFSSIFEGILIFTASFSIIISAFQRLIKPRQLENINIGIFISIIATLINFLVGKKLILAGKKTSLLLLKLTDIIF